MSCQSLYHVINFANHSIWAFSRRMHAYFLVYMGNKDSHQQQLSRARYSSLSLESLVNIGFISINYKILGYPGRMPMFPRHDFRDQRDQSSVDIKCVPYHPIWNSQDATFDKGYTHFVCGHCGISAKAAFELWVSLNLLLSNISGYYMRSLPSHLEQPGGYIRQGLYALCVRPLWYHSESGFWIMGNSEKIKNDICIYMYITDQSSNTDFLSNFATFITIIYSW